MLKHLFLFPALLLLASSVASAQNPHLVVYEGSKARASASTSSFWPAITSTAPRRRCRRWRGSWRRRYGFKCSVFFTTNPQTGFIEPGSSNIAGLEALRTADLMVVFLRFQDFPDAEMQHIADYLDRGGPVVGFRTATHAFQIKRPDAKFLKFDWQNKATSSPAASAGRFSARPGCRTTAPITR